MKDLNDFTTGDTLTAADFVIPMTEVQNVVEGTGQTLSAGDLNQLGKGISDYVANGDFYTDNGAADAYALTEIGSKQSPTAYTDGMRVRYEAANANTGASTVNVSGLGVKNIKLSGGVDPAAGDIDGRTELVYDSANGWFELVNPKVTGSAIAIFSSAYESLGNTITSAGLLTFAHGLGAVPKVIVPSLEAVAANFGYSIGDEVFKGFETSYSTTSTGYGYSVYADTTNIYVRFGAQSRVFLVNHKTTGQSNDVNNADWQLNMRAYS